MLEIAHTFAPAWPRGYCAWALCCSGPRNRSGGPLASGPPLYCDNRLLMADPELRAFVAEALAETIRQRYPDVELLAGTATAGIPHAAWVADRLRLPMVYVRPQPKEHGRGRQVEGRLIPGARTVLIEDLISTGSSSIRAAEALRREKAHMRGIVAIFSYSLPGTAARLAEAGLSAVALCGLEALLQQARRMGLLSEAQESLLRDWYRDPESWSRHYEQIHESGRSIHRG